MGDVDLLEGDDEPHLLKCWHEDLGAQEDHDDGAPMKLGEFLNEDCLNVFFHDSYNIHH